MVHKDLLEGFERSHSRGVQSDRGSLIARTLGGAPSASYQGCLFPLETEDSLGNGIQRLDLLKNHLESKLQLLLRPWLALGPDKMGVVCD